MPTLQITNLTKIYEGHISVPALENANLTIQQGEYVCITGPSGSGKSTLLNQIALLDLPSGGEYLIDETTTSRLSDAARARLRSATFAFIFQSFHLLDGRSARENVVLGALYRALPKDKQNELAQKALDTVGLANKGEQKVEKLSGGERQRVAIARAVASGAPVLVADEPTGNLDSKNAALIMDTLEKLVASGTTVIVVTHDPIVAARAPRRIEVLDGHVNAGTQLSTNDVPEVPHLTNHGRQEPEGTSSKVRFFDAIIDAWRGLWTKRVRTLSLVSSVALGVALAVTTLGLSQTAHAQVSDMFDAVRNTRITLTSPILDAKSTLTSENALSSEVASPEALRRLQKMSGVKEAAVFVTHGDLQIETSPPSAGQRASKPKTIIAGSIGMVGGQLSDTLFSLDSSAIFDHESMVLQEDEVIIGANLAAELNLGPLLASPCVWIGGKARQVVGILTDAGMQTNMLTSIISAEETASIWSPAAYATAEIRVVPGAGANVSQQAADAWLPRAPSKISVDAPPDPQGMRAEVESSVTTILGVLTGVALLAAVLSLTTAMTSAVFQRKGEFGLRRAIGARRIHVAGLVLTEAVAVGSIGGILGSYASMLAVLGITIAKHWQPVLALTLIPAGIAGGTIVGLLGGLIAALNASKVQPSDALRA